MARGGYGSIFSQRIFFKACSSRQNPIRSKRSSCKADFRQGQSWRGPTWHACFCFCLCCYCQLIPSNIASHSSGAVTKEPSLLAGPTGYDWRPRCILVTTKDGRAEMNRQRPMLVLIWSSVPVGLQSANGNSVPQFSCFSHQPKTSRPVGARRTHDYAVGSISSSCPISIGDDRATCPIQGLHRLAFKVICRSC